MTGNHHNRLRQLEGLVTIDAWHEGEPRSGMVDLHAYVHFDEARLGGQAGDEIAFRMLLRRADLKLLQSEPKSFDIDPALIWRGDQDVSGRFTQTTEISRSDTSSRDAHLSLKAAPELALTGGGRADNKTSERTEVISDRSTKTISVAFRRQDRDQPAWAFQPDGNAPRLDDIPFLKGQPWDDKQQRMLAFHVNTRHEQQEMLSSLRLCLLCRREDLHFYDIQIRTKSGEFIAIPRSSPKRVIVQEYLRLALLKEGLPAGDMDSPFSHIYLGEAISEKRRPGFDE